MRDVRWLPMHNDNLFMMIKGTSLFFGEPLGCFIVAISPSSWIFCDADGISFSPRYALYLGDGAEIILLQNIGGHFYFFIFSNGKRKPVLRPG